MAPVFSALKGSPTTINLFFSLIFGVGQVVVGFACVVSAARGGRWRRLGVGLTALVGAWFVASGLGELIVSGMETTRSVWRSPSATMFAAARAQVDSALFLWTLVLLAVAALYAGVWRWKMRPAAGRSHVSSARGTLDADVGETVGDSLGHL